MGRWVGGHWHPCQAGRTGIPQGPGLSWLGEGCRPPLSPTWKQMCVPGSEGHSSGQWTEPVGRSPGAVPWVRLHPLRWPQFPHMDHWLRCPPEILPRVQFRVQGLVIPPVHLSVHPSPLKYPLKASGCPAPTSAADAQFQGDPLPHRGENTSREGREDQQAGRRPRPAHLPSPCPARGQPRCPELESGRQEHRRQGGGQGWMGGCVGDANTAQMRQGVWSVVQLSLTLEVGTCQSEGRGG